MPKPAAAHLAWSERESTHKGNSSVFFENAQLSVSFQDNAWEKTHSWWLLRFRVKGEEVEIKGLTDRSYHRRNLAISAAEDYFIPILTFGPALFEFTTAVTSRALAPGVKEPRLRKR